MSEVEIHHTTCAKHTSSYKCRLLAVATGPSAVLALITLPATLLATFYVLYLLATGEWLCSEWRHGSCYTPVVRP